MKWWILEIKRAKRLSQALVHLVTARAHLFTDHRMSGLPMRAKYRHFKTICERTFDNSPTDPNSSSLNELMVIKAWSCNCPQMLVVFVRQLAISLHTFLCIDLPYHRTMIKCLRQASLNKVAFLLLLRRSWIRTCFCNCPQYLWSFRILVECNRNKRGQGRMLLAKIDFFHQYCPPTLGQCFVSSKPVLNHPNTQTTIVLFLGSQSDTMRSRDQPLQMYGVPTLTNAPYCDLLTPTWALAKCATYKWALTIWNFFPTVFQLNFLALRFPQ